MRFQRRSNSKATVNYQRRIGEVLVFWTISSFPDCQWHVFLSHCREDRARLVDLLLDSLQDAPDPEIEEAWRLEIRRRVAAYERGEAILFDADDVMAEAKRLAP